MANVIPALGTKLYIADVGESPTYTPVANILSINFPSAEVGETDTSHLGSGQIMTFRPARTDPGETTFDCQFNYGDTQHAALRALVFAPALKNFRLTSPTTPESGEDFQAFVKSCTQGVEGPDGNLEATVVLRVSGAATPYTAGS